jgi:hypothetical protein
MGLEGIVMNSSRYTMKRIRWFCRSCWQTAVREMAVEDMAGLSPNQIAKQIERFHAEFFGCANADVRIVVKAGTDKEKPIKPNG